MIIIGEKINGIIPVVREAIEKRDAAFIADRAIKQAEAGAHIIDVCASSALEFEKEYSRKFAKLSKAPNRTIETLNRLFGDIKD